MKFEYKPENQTFDEKNEAQETIWSPVLEKEIKSNILPLKENFHNDNLSLLQHNMGKCLAMIDDEVMKGYITKLDTLPVISPNAEMIASMQKIHFFKITGLVYEENEFSVHKLATVFHALSNKPCTLVLMIKSDGITNAFYLGVRSLDGKYSSGTMKNILKQSLSGMFPGSQVESYWDEELEQDMEQLCAESISSATCIADFKQDKEGLSNQEFLQGLEKFVYSMQGRTCTAIFIADNVSYDNLTTVRKEYEEIYTQISPFANMQMNFSVETGTSKADSQSKGTTKTSTYGITEGSTTSVSEGKTLTTGKSESYGNSDAYGTNEAVADGETNTVGSTDGTNKSVSDAHTEGSFTSVGVNAGVNLGVEVGASVNRGTTNSDTHTVTNGTSHTDSVSNAISKTLTHGISEMHTDSSTYGSNESESNTITYGAGTQNGKSYSVGDSFNLVDSQTLTDTFGNSQGITLNAQNRTLSATLERLNAHLERIDECESLGMWNFAAYFLGESAAETEMAANTYQSVVSGVQSGRERKAVNTWMNEKDRSDVITYVKNFMHPQFLYNSLDYEGSRKVVVNPAALVSTNELAIHMGLPRHSVKGLPVMEHASFAQEVLCENAKNANVLPVGKIFHMGEQTNTNVELDVDSLTMHTFITGSTGSGKSTTIYGLLDKLMKYSVKDSQSEKVKFMVIEPAKGEYKDCFGSYENVKVYGTNYKVTPLLKINPFSFPAEVHVLEHIDRLIEIFNVCWPMYAAMPAVLKESVERAYITSGWNLDMSECKYQDSKGNCLYPTFTDVLCQINNVMNESQYSSDSKGDYKGALCTRIKSLTNGLYGQIFASDELSANELFDENVIIDLSRVGSGETKSLIMGLLVMKLQEHRMSSAEGSNSSLRHVTVLEEAHNLLKRTSTEQSAEGANLLGKSVEMLANSIAEMRTYGEGFIIADQAPGLMDLSVIRNTNTKIILRLPDYADRELVGKAASLNEEQIVELSRLNTFVAAVYQNDWLEPVLCNMDVEFKDVKKYAYDYKCGQPFKSKQEIIKFLVLPVEKRDELDSAHINKLKDTIFKLPVSSETKVAFLKYTEAKLKSDVQYYRGKALYGLFNSEMAFYISGRKNGDIGSWYNLMKDSLEPDIQNLTEIEQQKIIAILAKEQAETDGTNESKMLFNHLMKYI